MISIFVLFAIALCCYSSSCHDLYLYLLLLALLASLITHALIIQRLGVSSCSLFTNTFSDNHVGLRRDTRISSTSDAPAPGQPSQGGTTRWGSGKMIKQTREMKKRTRRGMRAPLPTCYLPAAARESRRGILDWDLHLLFVSLVLW